MSTPALPSFANIGAVLVAIETVPGVEQVPGAPDATNFVLASNVKYMPEFDKVTRSYMRPSFSQPISRNANFRAKATFDVELMGSGTAIPGSPTAPQVAAAAPAWGKLLEACGMVAADVTSGSIGRVYTPTTLASTQKTVTLYFHLNGQLHKMTGAVGTFTMNMKAGEIGTVSFSMSGNYLAPVVTADPTIPAQTVVPPLVGGNFSFTGAGLTANTTLNATTVTVDAGNDVAPRASIAVVNGIDGYFVTGRAPTFTIDPERGTESTLTFFADLVNTPISSSLLQVGTASGNKIHLTLAKATMQGLEASSRDNMLSYDITYSLVSDTTTGNDEYSIRFA